jgi:hypothetical protein
MERIIPEILVSQPKKLAYKPDMNWEKQEVIRWKIKWLSETLIRIQF